ncbi:hypothetical protein [Chromobacterium piscinae]|uniref:hypothetical protein n=1 Tax=Chromobacterium amazonense TaxID=1382803 RepID=UPI000A8E0143
MTAVDAKDIIATRFSSGISAQARSRFVLARRAKTIAWQGASGSGAAPENE